MRDKYFSLVLRGFNLNTSKCISIRGRGGASSIFILFTSVCLRCSINISSCKYNRKSTAKDGSMNNNQIETSKMMNHLPSSSSSLVTSSCCPLELFFTLRLEFGGANCWAPSQRPSYIDDSYPALKKLSSLIFLKFNHHNHNHNNDQ